MSVGREVFGRMFNALARKIRSTDKFWNNVITNTKTLRRFVFVGGMAYISGDLFRHFVIDWGSSQGPSMYPTMAEKTPFYMTYKRYKYGKSMSPGDLVNLESPIFRDVHLGKRIIGTPGDFVVRDAHEDPSVGGAPVPGITEWQSSKSQDTAEARGRSEPMMIEIPHGHVYVTGDNMAWSRDSRFYGPVPMALIRGKQIYHANGGIIQGGQWTTGEQMRRIPKEEEEEYLNGYRQRRTEPQKVAKKEVAAEIAEKGD